MAIDWAFISELEGSVLTGYVPDPETSNSGVTIATGIDLGQRSAAQIAAMNIPEDLKARLTPYAGLRKQAAVDFLRANPLTVSAADAAALESDVRAGVVRQLTAGYDAAVGGKAGLQTFGNLADAPQTIIASVAFQYGNLATRTPHFWRASVSQVWTDVIKELRNFGDAYPTRRNKEANYLAQRV